GQFTVLLSAYNGHLAWNNDLIPEETIEYHPHHVAIGSASADDGDAPRALTTMSAMRTEFTVGRLMKDHKLYVDIINARGDTTVHIPVIDYALLMKTAHYSHMSDQEYLDRQDKYDMTFFLDKQGYWQAIHINVLSWTLVINNTDL
ncbi:MAG: FimB/Mfa2 family fimbrial subunit, partial [Muribaculaceae bacterium]|nr:FimB/Mfa2 family fimbrial subunit [Muribaculaceae bacterium]